MARWVLKINKSDIKELAKSSNISETVAAILSIRGIKTCEEVQQFLSGSISDLHDATLMKDMNKGTEIIREAILHKKRIAIYGDYDVDGVISTYILYSALRKCNANVEYYIPERESEGYGINSERLKLLRNEGCEVLLTCDNGISAAAEIKLAKELGMEVVVTDHHEVPYIEDEEGVKKSVLPDADAIIDCKQEDCNYPFKQLCGAGVAYKFSTVLYEKMGIPKEQANEFIEYVSMANVCDVVDILYENRILTKLGLEMLNKTKNTGLKALFKVLGLEDKRINSYHIGYMIGPCINATGRLDKAQLSLELLLCESPDRACEIASQLRDLNIKRQELTEKGFDEVCQIIEASDYDKDKVILVHCAGIHESIAGIIAGRVKEKYNRPAFVLTDSKDKSFAKGSGRSIEKYNMFEELTKCKELLEKFGGHQMAAGLTVKKENIEILRMTLNKNSTLEDRDFIPKLTIDKHMPLSEVTLKLVDELEMLEPFGKGNPSPIFADKNIPINKFYILGANKNTLKLICYTENSRIDALGFNQVEKFENLLKEKYGTEKSELILSRQSLNSCLDIAFVPSLNTYNGVTSVQLRMLDFRVSENGVDRSTPAK